MREAKGRSVIVGCVGVLCFALYWAAWLVPQVADALPNSINRKVPRIEHFSYESTVDCNSSDPRFEVEVGCRCCKLHHAGGCLHSICKGRAVSFNANA